MFTKHSSNIVQTFCASWALIWRYTNAMVLTMRYKLLSYLLCLVLKSKCRYFIKNMGVQEKVHSTTDGRHRLCDILNSKAILQG